MVNATSQPLYAQERDPIHTAQEAGWAPGPVRMGAENLPPTPGFDPWTLQSVASRYIDYTIPAPGYRMYLQETRLSSSFHHSIMMTCAWERKKITNLKSSCTIMPLKVELMFWTACEGIDLHEIENILQLD